VVGGWDVGVVEGMGMLKLYIEKGQSGWYFNNAIMG